MAAVCFVHGALMAMAQAMHKGWCGGKTFFFFRSRKESCARSAAEM